MSKFILLTTLVINCSAYANEQCTSALLKSVLYEVNVSEKIEDLSNCKLTSRATCQFIKANLVQLREDANKVHLVSNKTCSKNS